METLEVKKVLETLLFVSEKPLSLKELKNYLKTDFAEADKIETILTELKEEYAAMDKPFEIKFVAEGWTFSTKPEYGMWVNKIFKEKKILKLSPSALDTLAVIAYKQPITRAEIDEVRGVESSSGIMDTLVGRKLIKVVGRKEVVGKPLLYGTTQEFLKHFGLAHLNELPLIENTSDFQEKLSQEVELLPELPFKETKIADGPDNDDSKHNEENELYGVQKSYFEDNNDEANANFANENNDGITKS
jgi:segregation and condensation protein B